MCTSYLFTLDHWKTNNTQVSRVSRVSPLIIMPSRQRPWIIEVGIFVSSVIASDKLNCLVLFANRSMNSASEKSPLENVFPDVSPTEKNHASRRFPFPSCSTDMQRKSVPTCAQNVATIYLVSLLESKQFMHSSIKLGKVLVCFIFSQDFIVVLAFRAGVLLPVEREKNCQRCKCRITKKTDNCVSSRQCFDRFPLTPRSIVLSVFV